MAGDDDKREWPKTDRVRCTEVSGVSCDFVAELDESVDRAARGSVVDQLLAQLTTHIAKRHPERALSPDEISALRDKLNA